jgi:hypothetical protein
LSTDDNFVYALARCLAILGTVHHKVGHGLTLTIVAEIVQEGISEELGVTGGAGQVTGWDDEIGITVVNLYRETG